MGRAGSEVREEEGRWLVSDPAQHPDGFAWLTQLFLPVVVAVGTAWQTVTYRINKLDQLQAAADANMHAEIAATRREMAETRQDIRELRAELRDIRRQEG